jgi:hypothetical protein
VLALPTSLGEYIDWAAEWMKVLGSRSGGNFGEEIKWGLARLQGSMHVNVVLAILLVSA